MVAIGWGSYQEFLSPENDLSSGTPSSVPKTNPPKVSLTPTSAPTSTSSPTPTPKTFILNAVPFVAQAPFGNWDDPRQQDGCEEASIVMAYAWTQEVSALSKQEGLDRILAISQFSEEQLGMYHDTSTEDTVKLFTDYYAQNSATLYKDVSIKNIIDLLRGGNIIIAPTNGRLLENPNFTAPGPEYHMLVIIGFDDKKKEFITNDPGTRQGASYRYSYDRLFGAIADYETGQHEPRKGIEKNVISIKKL